jgi:hypothetical protein
MGLPNQKRVGQERVYVITYAERKCFRPSALQLLASVEALVERVSAAWGNELRCHELVRAVHQVVYDGGKYMLAIVDGKCGPIEHSWLWCSGVILDPYVPGRLPSVQIVDPLVGAAYRPGDPRTDIRQAIVDRLVVEMRGKPVSES